MALGVRKSYKGGAQATTLAGPITSNALSFTVTSGHGNRFPDGSDGPFVMEIDDEQILCDSRSGDVFTIGASGRAHDNTVAAAHSPGAGNVKHVLDAESLTDHADHIYDTTRNDHTQYPLSTAVVLKSLYDANSVVIATSDNTPIVLPMGPSTILVRLASGDIIAGTPAQLRTLLDVPTNAEAILDTIVDAAGDLIYGTAADTVGRLAAGTNGHVLTLAAGLPSWAAPSTSVTLGRFSIDAIEAPESTTGFTTYAQSSSRYFGYDLFTGGTQNDEVVFDLVDALQAGTWTFVLAHMRSTDRGIYTIAVSPDASAWTTLTTIDGYAGSPAAARSAVTGLTVAASMRYVRLKMATKNGSSSSYVGDISYLGGVRTA